MSKLIAKAKAFCRDEDGATATEYAVLLALVALVVILAGTALGDQINTVFQTVTTALSDAVA